MSRSDEGPLPFLTPFSLFSVLVRVMARFFLAQGPLHMIFFYIFVVSPAILCVFLFFFTFSAPRDPPGHQNTIKNVQLSSKIKVPLFSKNRAFEPTWVPLWAAFGPHGCHFGQRLGSLGSLWWPLGPQGRPKVRKKRVRNAS